MSFWEENTQKMVKEVEIDHVTKIEDQKLSTIVDFANKYIGGGVLKGGCVQEEILFFIFPQLFVTVLFCERMLDNEAIFIHNVRRYSNYTGYGGTLEFSGTFD